MVIWRLANWVCFAYFSILALSLNTYDLINFLPSSFGGFRFAQHEGEGRSEGGI